ncbi:MAG: molybdopterin-dependent oxidoreductase [Halieaceae bacterium]|jgi:DMSO reductase family type II enzyme molybdopterin subunit|nr:molybdopterin-dependent oxidoreductase [Halieaceae bacterium]
MTGITRRSFLGATGSTLALSLMQLTWKPGGSVAQAGSAGDMPLIDYEGFEAIYHNKWQWDSVAKGTHFVNCWYQRGCNWNVYVKDGIVWREEQAGTYEQVDPKIPDYNPRGCQKGACYSERMYDASRLRHPLKRVGERGAGKWQRISWEQALEEVADKTIDAMVSEAGPGSIIWDQGTAQTNGGAGLGMSRTALVLDTPVLDVNTEIGDHRPGFCVTTGKMVMCSSSDDLFYSDMVFIWGGNPIYTQIPQAHFITEARYNGAKVITIAPDFSASAIHADQYVPVKVASDAALGLSMAQVMIEEGIYNREFVVEQTDLALLSRVDNGRFLREADLENGGADDIFYLFDQTTKEIREASKKTLALEALDPALEGEFEVDTPDGRIMVRPVFAQLREHVQQYVPEKAVKICGVDPQTIRGLARDLANARAATCISQSNFSKFYHGIEMERAQILCFALAGQMGKKGAGYMSFPYLSIDGHEGLTQATGKRNPKLALAAVGLKMAPRILKKKYIDGLTAEMTVFELGREEYKHGAFPSTLMWLYHQGGLEELYGSSDQWDPDMKRPLSSYMDEAIDKGWQFKPETKPRIFFEAGGNVLRRIRGYDVMIDKLLPELDMLVTIDWRMSNTALYSDYVFPAAAWYEKDDITWATPLSPFSQVITKAAEPIAEAKPDWEFHCLLLKTIQRRAAERGIAGFRDRHGHQREFDVYDEFTFGGRYTEDNIEDFLDLILELSTNVGDINWKQLKEKGFKRFTDVGRNGYMNIGNATDVREDDTITTGLWHTRDKMPWPTLTRRLQFCIDHPFYEELGETLPVHKDQPNIGGDYPLYLTGGHTRWSIHASWRDQKYMLQLNRGEPVIFIGVEDALTRGIEDAGRVRVFNDISSIEMQARVTASHRPGQVTVYHAWEPFMFKNRKGYSAVTPNPINPVQLAGGYFHLQPRPAVCTPGSTDRATRVDVERVVLGVATAVSTSAIVPSNDG